MSSDSSESSKLEGGSFEDIGPLNRSCSQVTRRIDIGIVKKKNSLSEDEENLLQTSRTYKDRKLEKAEDHDEYRYYEFELI